MPHKLETLRDKAAALTAKKDDLRAKHIEPVNEQLRDITEQIARLEQEERDQAVIDALMAREDRAGARNLAHNWGLTLPDDE